MANVQLPDGSVVAFPDGTPDQVMNAAIEQHLAPPPPDNLPSNPISNYANAARLALTKGGNAMIGLGADATNAVGLSSDEDTAKFKSLLSDADKTAETNNPTYPGLSRFLGENVSGNPTLLAPGGVLTSGAVNGGYSALKNTDPSSSIGDKVGETAIGSGFGAIAGKVLNAALAPAANTVKPYVSKLADYITSKGVDLSPAQQTGSGAYKAMESVFNNTPIASAIQHGVSKDQQGQFTQAVLSETGMTPAVIDGMVASGALPEGSAATNATRDVINAGYQRAGKAIGDITKPYTLNNDAQLQQDAIKTLGDYEHSIIDPFQKKSVNDIASDITSKPTMSGEQYQNTRSMLGRMARSNVNNPEYSSALGQLQNALDDAMERSVPADIAPQLAQARTQYGNMKTVMKAMKSNSDDALVGNITPARLGSAMQSNNATGFVTGKGALNKLQEAGANFIHDDAGAGGHSVGTPIALVEAAKHGLAGAGMLALGGLPLALQQLYNKAPGYFIKGVPYIGNPTAVKLGAGVAASGIGSGGIQ